MNRTERRTKACQQAHRDELELWRLRLCQDVTRERNPMKRASAQAQLRIVEAELSNREVVPCS